MTYSRAGHNPPRLVRQGSVLSLDDVGGLPLGVLPNQTYEEAIATLHVNDLLLLYTDGITDAASGDDSPSGGSTFGIQRLDRVLSGLFG